MESCLIWILTYKYIKKLCNYIFCKERCFHEDHHISGSATELKHDLFLQAFSCEQIYRPCYLYSVGGIQGRLRTISKINGIAVFCTEYVCSELIRNDQQSRRRHSLLMFSRTQFLSADYLGQGIRTTAKDIWRFPIYPNSSNVLGIDLVTVLILRKMKIAQIC